MNQRLLLGTLGVPPRAKLPAACIAVWLADVLQRQAKQYGKIFADFLQHSNAIARITFWDLHDGRS